MMKLQMWLSVKLSNGKEILTNVAVEDEVFKDAEFVATDRPEYVVFGRVAEVGGY